LAAIWQTSESKTGLNPLIRKSVFESWITFGLGQMPWGRFALSEHSPVISASNFTLNLPECPLTSKSYTGNKLFLALKHYIYTEW